MKGVRDELLEPNTFLMLLLLADVLVQVNWFSRNLQTRNLIFATLARKFVKLVESMQHLAENDGPSFSEHAVQFLTVAKERMALASRLRGREDVLEEDEADRVNRFHQQVKALFMTSLIEELQNALQINDPVFLAFDVFNVTKNYSFKSTFLQSIMEVPKHQKWVTVPSQLHPTFLMRQLMNKQLRPSLQILITQ